MRGPVKVSVITQNGKAEKGTPGDHRQKEKEVVTSHARGVCSGISGAAGRGEFKPKGTGGGKSGALKELEADERKGSAGALATEGVGSERRKKRTRARGPVASLPKRGWSRRAIISASDKG